MKKEILSNKSITNKLIVYEITGFIVVIISDWIVALFDPPYNKFKPAFSLVVIKETALETVIHLILCIIVVYWTMKLIKKLKYLEGFMVICANCKRIRIDENWVQIEKIISDNSNLMLSHGICDDCSEKLYGDIINHK